MRAANFTTPAAQFVLCALAFAVSIGLSWRLTADEAPQVPGSERAQKSQLRREGTELRDEPGRFLAAGNRLTFVSASGETYIGLENLSLERVGKIVGGSSEPVDWFITGTVSEYQGANYLLITRARRKASLPAVRRRF